MDIAERLEQILGDEETFSQIQQMAAALGGGGQQGSPDTKKDKSGDIPPGLDPNLLGSLMGMLGGMPGGDGSDPGVELLRALKPFLSKRRRKRAAEAVKIIKLLEMIPLLQQSGMLGGLMGGSEDDDY